MAMTKNKKLIIILSVVTAVVLLIIIMGAVFSVQHVTANCMNDVDAALDEKIEKDHGIRYGSSIFTLNEEKASAKIQENLSHSGIGNVSVVGIERVFPNRIIIHYIKTTDYYHIVEDGKIYTVSNKGRITNVADSLPLGAETVLVKTGGVLAPDSKIGDNFNTDHPLDRKRLSAVTYTFDRLQSPYIDRTRFFEFVDISKNYIYIKTARSVYIEIFAPSTLTEVDFAEQFRVGLSLYENFLNADPQNPNHIDMAINSTIIVTRPASGGEPYATYSPENKYTLR